MNGPDETAGSTSLLTFTPFTWAAPQTVTVTGVDDNLDQSSNRIVTITHGASSTDPLYQGISIPSVSATVVDDENAVPAPTVVGVTVGNSASIAEGDSVTFTFSATPRPWPRVHHEGELHHDRRTLQEENQWRQHRFHRRAPSLRRRQRQWRRCPGGDPLHHH